MNANEEFDLAAKKFIEAKFTMKLLNPMYPEDGPKPIKAVTNFLEATIDGETAWFQVHVKRLSPEECQLP